MSSTRKPFTMQEIFWGNMRREFMEILLTVNGAFLVRKTSRGDSLVLSVYWNGIKHFQPLYDEHGYSFDVKSFPSLEDVLLYHFNQKIPLGGDRDVLLKRPIKKMKTIFKLWEVETLGAIGEGNFGKVAKVRIKQDGRVVGMKTLKDNVPTAMRDAFVKEVSLMQTMEHINVIKYLGVIDEGDGQLNILMELINRGSLGRLLRVPEKLTYRGKMRCILDVAGGMQFLHSMDIIHRGLTAHKIQLQQTNEGNIICKVGDFGLSRQDEPGRAYELKTLTKLPPKWMAPECFRAKRWTKASDVWSLGVVAWEVFADGADPYYDVPEAQGVVNLSRFICGGGHVTHPDQCRDDMWAVMLKIFNHDDARRVTMDDVHDDVERIYAILKMEEEARAGIQQKVA